MPSDMLPFIYGNLGTPNPKPKTPKTASLASSGKPSPVMETALDHPLGRMKEWWKSVCLSKLNITDLHHAFQEDMAKDLLKQNRKRKRARSASSESEGAQSATPDAASVEAALLLQLIKHIKWLRNSLNPKLYTLNPKPHTMEQH